MNSLFSKESILLLFILFIPQSGFVVFYCVVIPCALLVIILNGKISVRGSSFNVIYSILVLMLTWLVAKVFMHDNLFDIKEFLKVLLFFSVYIASKNVTIELLERYLFVYICIDLLISLAQFYHLDYKMLSMVSHVYNAEKHVILLHLNNVRALGLSPGPGTHGVLSLFIFWVFGTLLIFHKRYKYRILGVLFSLVTLLLSQSKTAFLALVVSVLLFSVLVMLHSHTNYSSKIMFSVFMCTIVGGGVYFFEKIISTFSGIQKMYTAGMDISSVHTRLYNWDAMFQSIKDSPPILILFGAGRSFLTNHDIHNAFFDNDYIYTFVSYGVVGLLVLTIILTVFLVKGTLNFNDNLVIDKIAYMIVFAGSIASFSVAFFSDLQIIALLAMLLAIRSENIHAVALNCGLSSYKKMACR